MAIAFDNATSGTAGNNTSLTFSHTNTAGNLLVVQAGVPVADTITSVTYNGVSLTKINSAQSPSPDGRFTSLWYLLAPATGANNIVISSSASDFLFACAATYTGVKQQAPEASGTNTANATNQIIASVTPTSDNSWMFLAVRVNDDPTTNYTVTNGTIRGTSGVMASSLIDFGPVSPAASTSITVHNNSFASLFWGTVIASFAPSTGGGGATLPYRSLLGVGK